jgi:hypothetical protein
LYNHPEYRTERFWNTPSRLVDFPSGSSWRAGLKVSGNRRKNRFLK